MTQEPEQVREPNVEAYSAKAEWHKEQARLPLPEKIRILLELQEQDLPRALVGPDPSARVPFEAAAKLRKVRDRCRSGSKTASSAGSSRGPTVTTPARARRQRRLRFVEGTGRIDPFRNGGRVGARRGRDDCSGQPAEAG